jgi:formylglycine-generating enzyme required for sulfatase activity
MSAKEISVFVLGLMLVGFLYLMKHPSNQAQTFLSQPTNNQTVGIDIIDKNQSQPFDPSTKTPILDSILDIPALKINADTLIALTSDELVNSIEKAIKENRYFNPKQNNALFYLINLRSIDKDNPKLSPLQLNIQSQLDSVIAQAIENNDTKQLIDHIAQLKTLDTDNNQIKNLEKKLTTIKTINRLYSTGTQYLQNNIIIASDSHDAWHIAKQMTQIDANNSKTHILTTEVRTVLINNALRAAEETDFQLAQDQIEQAVLLDPNSEVVLFTQEQINQLKQKRYLWLEQQISMAIKHANVTRATKMLEQMADLGLSTNQLIEYKDEITRITILGKYNPFDTFADVALNKTLPEMVVMPTGSYLMGSQNGPKYEKPIHQVNINYGFAISKNEISVNDFKLFIENSGYKTDAEINNTSRIYDLKLGRLKNKNHINWQNNYIGKKSKNNNPVIHVSWNDALAYSQWLSQRTEKNYRLVTEAEFEYALRAGSRSTYPWGEGTPKQVIENLTGNLDKSKDNPRFRWKKGFEKYNDQYWGPAPVGSFISNPFRLNDTAGNVMEWVMDCWHDSYTRAPTDGSSWINPGCEKHVIRGGSWSSSIGEFTSSHRFKAKANFTDARLGFRIAVDLK